MKDEGYRQGERGISSPSEYIASTAEQELRVAELVTCIRIALRSQLEGRKLDGEWLLRACKAIGGKPCSREASQAITNELDALDEMLGDVKEET